MKKITFLFTFFALAFTYTANAQCPTIPPPATPAFTYCYDSNEVDVVIGEVCPVLPTDIAEAYFQVGDWENTYDFITVYEGASGSGITGTLVAGPLTGVLTGIQFTATTPGNCLIFVSNSDGSVSCASGSRDTAEIVAGTIPPPPTYDYTYCYDSGEVDVVMFEMTPAAGQTVTASICAGNWEAGFDNLTVYEGAAGSGTGGTIVAGPLDGDLAGTVINSTTPGMSLIFVSNSDGSISCASGSRTPAGFSEEYTLATQDFDNGLAFTYYPNPVNNALSLKAQKDIENVSVYNMLGQEVLRTAPNAVNTEVNMSALQSGAYFVKVTIGNATETVRIIKN
ncbi:MAG: T9SS type A sorting domain-containing protein [Oceanihabitans sp.]